MKIKMKQDKLATANEAGSETLVYKKDSELDMSEAWQMKLASKWLNNGVAEQVKPVTEKKVITEVQKRINNEWINNTNSLGNQCS